MVTAAAVWTHIQGGNTALMCAAANGHADCVRLLVDAGASKDANGHVRFSFFLIFQRVSVCLHFLSAYLGVYFLVFSAFSWTNFSIGAHALL